MPHIINLISVNSLTFTKSSYVCADFFSCLISLINSIIVPEAPTKDVVETAA